MEKLLKVLSLFSVSHDNRRGMDKIKMDLKSKAFFRKGINAANYWLNNLE